MQDFPREDRYIVIKKSDVGPSVLTDLEKLMANGSLRQRRGVFVEHDWPEHEAVWRMLETRTDLHSVQTTPRDAFEAFGRDLELDMTCQDGVFHAPKTAAAWRHWLEHAAP